MSGPDVDVERDGVLVDVLFLLMRAIAVYGTGHPQASKAAQRLCEAVTVAEPPFTLQLVGEGLFRDRMLVPVEASRFKRLQEISRVLHILGAHELAFEVTPDPEELLPLGRALAEAQSGTREDLRDVQVAGMRWREIQHARQGLEADDLDQGLHALTQLSLASKDCHRIAELGIEVWRFALGLSVVRHLERTCHADLASAARALEMAPGRWTPARRALSATFHTVAVLENLGTRGSPRRALAHACLILAFYGYDQRAGRPLEEAAVTGLARVLAAPVTGHSGIPPHVLQVCTLLHLLNPQNDSDPQALPGLELVRLCYHLERRRRPLEVNYTPGKAELLAQLASQPDTDPDWFKALLATAGHVPAGTFVRAADGEIGVSLGPGETPDPWRPQTLFAGGRAEPSAPVDLIAQLDLG